MWDTQVVALQAFNQNSALSLFLRGLYIQQIQQIKYEWCDNSTLRIRTKIRLLSQGRFWMRKWGLDAGNED